MKFKCDHCGQIVESGIANVSAHPYECSAQYTVKVNEMFSFIVYPHLKLTPLEEPANTIKQQD